MHGGLVLQRALGCALPNLPELHVVDGSPLLLACIQDHAHQVLQLKGPKTLQVRTAKTREIRIANGICGKRLAGIWSCRDDLHWLLSERIHTLALYRCSKWLFPPPARGTQLFG